MGVDPGYTGAIATLHRDCVLQYLGSIPILSGKNKPDKIPYYDHDLIRLSFAVQPVDLIAIEKQQVYKAQGLVSSGTTMYGWGTLRQAVIGAYGPSRVCDVTVHQWRKANGWVPPNLPGKGNVTARRKYNKEQAISLALALCPEFQDWLDSKPKKYHDGAAEAILIANYARKKGLGLL